MALDPAGKGNAVVSSRGRLKDGMVHVYTGDGKGKTTAALGLALRALGHGLTVYVIQFMKGDPDYGELRAGRRLDGLTIRQFGRTDFVDRDHPAEEDLSLARQGLEHAAAILAAGDHDLVILDEINVALDFGLVPLGAVLELIGNRPRNVELVLTGRSAPRAIIEAADLVTEMREVKHYYQQGRTARDGIEH
jgi:cob(I)alamin adenosyltransferase